jgi:mannose-6-phosphate isomerase-like protein (cupin superfamily)
MQPQVIKPKNIKPKHLGVLIVKELFNTPEFPSMGCALIELRGKNRQVKNTRCNSFYYILKGRGKFTLNGTTYSQTRRSSVCTQ